MGGISEWMNKSMTNVWRMIGWIYKAIVVIGMSDSDNEIALFIQLEIRLLNQIINDQTTIPGMGWKVFMAAFTHLVKMDIARVQIRPSKWW